jgi:hypothetical protein
MQEDIIVSQPSTVHIETLVTVTPIPPDPNKPPTVSAGQDQTITLPINSVALDGTASDPDGTIASTLWEKLSGSGTITDPTAIDTQLTGLTEGVTVLRFGATDNDGATTYAQTTITTKPAPTPPPSGYTETYKNGYDTNSDINSNQLGRGSISPSVFKTGTGSFRSEVRAGDPPISSGWRSEQQYDQASQNPKIGALEYDAYYENWGSADGGGHTMQWHPNTGGASAIVSLQNMDGKFKVVRSLGGTNWYQGGVLQGVISNRWYHLRWEYNWSTGSDGYIRLYIDGVLYYSFNGKTADGSGQYTKVGTNRWPNSGNTMTKTSVCYYDNLVISKLN